MRHRLSLFLAAAAAGAVATIATVNGAAQSGGAGAPNASSGGVPPPAAPSGPLTIVSVTKPTKSGDDFITVTYKLPGSNGPKQVTAATGEPGTAHASDDIPKGMDPVAKAKRYADAVNLAARDPGSGGNPRNPPVAASVLLAGDPPQPTAHVTITALGGPSVTSVQVTDHSGQQEKKTQLPHAAAPSSSCVGTARFVGPIHGVDDDGAPAEASVGTGSYTSVVSTADFLDAAQLAAAIAADLAAHGVEVELVDGALVLSVTQDGRTIVAGTNDRGLATVSSLGTGD